MTISYTIANSLYLNITNKCNCACVFCVRNLSDGIGDGDNLWLDHDPSADEVIADIKKRGPLKYDEVVFCGYGEPTESLDVLLSVSRFLKENYPQIPVRLNTNGLSDLSRGKQTAPLLKGLVDAVSISLNAPNRQRYSEVTNPVFGEAAYDAMIRFAKSVKESVPRVTFTVVNVLSKEELTECEKLAADMGIPLRVRGNI